MPTTRAARERRRLKGEDESYPEGSESEHDDEDRYRDDEDRYEDEDEDYDEDEGYEEDEDYDEAHAEDETSDEDEADEEGDGREPRAEDDGQVTTASAAAKAAVDQIAALTAKQPEGVVGVEHGDDGWRVSVEVVEDKRIPSSADILAIYEVAIGNSGDLTSYRRTRRYGRGHGDGGYDQ